MAVQKRIRLTGKGTLSELRPGIFIALWGVLSTLVDNTKDALIIYQVTRTNLPNARVKTGGNVPPTADTKGANTMGQEGRNFLANPYQNTYPNGRFKRASRLGVIAIFAISTHLT